MTQEISRTELREIYDMFLSKITDYRLLSMVDEEIEELLYDYYMSASALFYKCKNDLSTDTNKRHINSKLTDLEKRIIVLLMLVEHITPQLVSSEKMQQTLNDKDFKIYSQANQLREVRLLLERMERRANKLITQYTFLDIEMGEELMINDKRKLASYLNSVVDKVFKILPLFEEKNVGLNAYVDSLLFELYGLQEAVSIDDSSDYISLLSTLESIKYEMCKNDIRKAILRRELFKCINIVKTMITKIEKAD